MKRSVAQRFLNDPQIRTFPDHVGNERMPQRMDAGVLDARPRHVLLDDPLDGPSTQRGATPGKEKAGAIGGWAFGEVICYRLAGLPVESHGSLPAAFTFDANRPD